MQRCVQSYRELEARGAGIALAIGNFDGVHRGHQALVRMACELASGDGTMPVVLTFDPHPTVALGFGGPPVLTPTRRKVELLLRLDPRLQVIVQPFDQEFAALSADEFVHEVLVRGLGVRHVVVGRNFRFGHSRAGDNDRLAVLGAQLGFDAYPFELAGDGGSLYSSTRVRQALKEGNVETAEAVLGRPAALSGIVVGGDGRGRTIGFPTANLDQIPEALPAPGVYAVLVDQLDSQGRGSMLGTAVMHVGPRPTVERTETVEIHVLSPVGDLYGAQLRVHLVSRLRGILKMPSLEALVAQISQDIEEARRHLLSRKAEPAAEGAWY
jgi:riboflavin kinase / FMN adenylyltransferase